MKTIALLSIALLTSSCVATKDISQNLRFADNKRVDVSTLKFAELQKMKTGKACTWNFIAIPMFGDGSILTAAKNGEVNSVQLIGETGFWAFPMVKNCTVVYGDAPALESVVKSTK